MALGKKTWLGIAREATPGTPATTPTLFMPCKAKFQDKTKFVYVDEDRNTRDANNDRVGTIRYATGDISGAIYLNDFGYLLLGFMGADTATQPDNALAPTAYQHAFTLADTPPALTLFKGYDAVKTYLWSYSAVEKLKLKFSADGKLLEHQTNVQGLYRAAYGGAPIIPTYGTAIKPFGGYAGLIKLGGTQDGTISEMEIDLEQKISLYYASQGDSTLRGFTVIDYGERKASMSFKARFDNTTQYDKFTSETDESVQVTFTGANLGGTVNEKLDINFPIVGYDDMELDTSKDYIELSVKGTARPGATVNSLFTATLINTTVAYTS